MIVEHRFAHIPQDARRSRAWIVSQAPVVEAHLHPAATVPLAAYLRYHHLGDGVFGVFEAPAQTTERTEALVLRQALDHFVLRAHGRGRARITVDGMTGEAGPGDIILLDLGCPYRIEAEPAVGVELFLPRRVLAADGGEGISVRNGRILAASGHPLIRMVADHLGNLAACLSASPPVPAIHIVPATLGLCRVLLAVATEQGGDAHASPDRVAMRRFVEENLATVDISGLMARFGLSRTSLYQRFGAREGVAAYIRDRRLAAAMRRLSEAARRPKLARLAHECGFANPRAFSRAFHRKYGLWPAEMASAEGYRGLNDWGTTPMAWLRDL